LKLHCKVIFNKVLQTGEVVALVEICCKAITSKAQ